MSKTVPADMPAREEILHNLDMNILVEAGAGSGKTTSMVGRMVSLITEKKVPIENIAAITFTRKAAAELKERFQNKLEERFRTEKDDALREVLKTALYNMEQCYIGTIHSFCACLLRERPVEGGIDPDFTELDEMTDAVLHSQAWQQFLIQIRSNSPERLQLLNEIGLKPSDLEGIFQTITDYPDVRIACTKVSKPELRPVFEKLKPLLFKAYAYIPKTEPEKGYDGLQESILWALRLIRYYDMNSETNLLQVLERFEKEKRITQNRWLCSKDIVKGIHEEFKFLSQSELSPLLVKWREYCHGVAMDFLMPAVTLYDDLKKRQGGLNFQDLLMKSVQMLKNYPEVRRYFQNRYRYLLIDEFQDTDPIQAELMFYLTGQDTDEKDWSRLIPIPGSLFVVGDPKQSIYRFRRADIDIYNRVKRIIEQTGGKTLMLTTNFRSVEVLGNWFNEAFQSLLPSVADTFQASFTCMQTVRDSSPDTASGVWLNTIPEIYQKKDEMIRADAHAIARTIRAAVDGKSFQLTRAPQELDEGRTTQPEYRDFMLLLRYKDSMEVYTRILEEYGIPVQMSGGSSLSDVEELHEFIILLQYLKDPENQVLLIAVLRGIFFGISDAQLAEYKAAGGSFRRLGTLPEPLPEETKNLFQAAFDKLKMYIGWTKVLAPISVLEKTAEDLGLVPLILAGKLPQAGCGYFYKILELLRKKAMEQFETFPGLVDQFQQILEQDLDEELDISCDEKNAVRVMNLHKAKGLEAPVVFLAHPCKRPSISPDRHIHRDGEDCQGYFLIKKDTGEFSSRVIGQPVNWAEHERAEQAYQDAEETRLLYVAATRARNLLIISSSKKSNAKNPWEPLLNFIGEDTNAIPEEPADARNVIEADGNAKVAQAAKQAGEPVLQPEIPDTAVETKQPLSGHPIRPEQLCDFLKEVSDFAEIANQPGYAEASPSEIMKQEPLHTVKGGLGAEWGTAVHKIVEKTVRGEENLNLLVPMILQQKGFSGQQYEQMAMEIIQALMQSELYARITRAAKRLAEVPFCLKLNAEDPIFTEFCSGRAAPLTLEGVIDLAIQEEDGWSIIDYKTNHIETDQDLLLLVQHYSTQIRLYCRVWERITGMRVKSGELYFTERGLIKVYP